LNLFQENFNAQVVDKDEALKPADLKIANIEVANILPLAEGPIDETIVLRDMRPVFTIRDNKISFDDSSSDSIVWKERLQPKADILNSLITKVGRIEVNNNAVYNWVGTGWLIARDVIVTNRHVANIFSINAEGFKFKVGYPSGFQSSKIDFLEEDKRTTSFEFEIESVLWMSENIQGEPDVAFMRIKQNVTSNLLPNPIELIEPEGEGEVVVTVGYPARDPRIPDQDLVLKIFGDIYDKKRLAPGLITTYDKSTIQHDCSTLGGESGGVVISLKSGKAVGLHFGGLFMKGNFAVSALVLMDLLQKLKKGTLPRTNSIQNNTTTTIMENTTKPTQNNSNKISVDLNIPLKLTFEIGAVSVSNGNFPTIVNAKVNDSDLSFSEALTNAKNSLLGKKGIIDVYPGYRFKNGWITNEQVIVVDVQQKLTLPQIRISEGLELIPREFGKFGTDVRTATINDQIDYLGISLPELEAVPKSGVYKEPPSLKLEKVHAQMKAIFHVSPDSGFPNLKSFFERIEKNLTATIYEWDAKHISDSLFKAISSNNGNLKMVTQRPGTKEAVEEMKSKLGAQFDHVWASVGAGKIVPSAYHIKVASRDEKEFWLSSGNWKDSNQADINPAGENSTNISPLRQHNREWNVIIENANLAKLFQNYIDWDFQEAQRIPLDEGVAGTEIFLLIPDTQPELVSESRPIAKYFKPKVVDKILDIQPLLTPDHNDSGQRMFIQIATELINSAEKSIDIQNQSFSLLDENDEEYERFFNTILQKQNEGVIIRIIFRDPTEFSRTKGEENLKKQLDRLKAFGLDTSNMKVQKKCHNKAIIVDSEDSKNAAVLFGSHNLTTSGALFNRDASLLIRDQEIAEYFQQIFDFDWLVLAEQKIEESIGGIQMTTKEAPVPIGFQKIALSEFLSEG
jgi:hypothetical protein